MSQKLQTHYVFIAVGIGITPFRSMIKYLLDTNQTAQITLFYATKNSDEFLFDDIWKKAEKHFGLKTIFILNKMQKDWSGEVGQIDPAMIKKYIKDLLTPVYYISGAQEKVTIYREMLERIGVQTAQIKTDLFTGYE